MQLFFHLVYLPILYGKAKKVQKQKQKKNRQERKKNRARERARYCHVFFFILILHFACKNLQKSNKKDTKPTHACK